MKKLITLLLCAALVVMPSLAFADDFDFLTGSAKNSTYTTELTITLDKPLEIFSLLSENNMLGDTENYMDIRKFCEGLFGTELSCSAKINMSNDFKKIKLQMLMDSKLPLDVNNNLSMDVNAKCGIWMELDFTDEENPKIDIICSNPFMNKYLHLTQDDLAENSQMSTTSDTSVFKAFNAEYFRKVSEKSVEIVKEYCDITRKGNTYVIKYTDEAFKKCLLAAFKEIAEEIPDYPEIDFSEVEDALSKIRILGDRGIEIEYNLSNGKLSTVKEICSVDINIYDIAQALGETLTDFLPRDKCSVAFTVNSYSVYTDVGTTNNFDFPALTEQNTFKLPEYEYYPEVSEYEYKPYPSYYIYAEMGELVYDNNKLYVPFRDLIEDYLFLFTPDEDYTITYKDGIIYFSCEAVGIKELAFVTYSGDCWLNGEKFTYSPSKNICGVTFVESRMMEEMFNWSLESTGTNYLDNVSYVSYMNNCYE